MSFGTARSICFSSVPCRQLKMCSCLCIAALLPDLTKYIVRESLKPQKVSTLVRGRGGAGGSMMWTGLSL